MSYDISLPNINSPTDAGKIQQIYAYLHQLAGQLNWALNTIDGGGSGNVIYKGGASTASDMTEEQTKATFNSIKSLIINSADIVNAFSTKISERYSGMYVAQSDFGTYMEETDQLIEKSDKAIESLYTNIQQILTDIENLEYSLIEVNAHIRSGLLYTDDDGIPVFGLEVGQKNTVDGEEIFNKFARFISDRLSFYDQNDTEVAYISDYKLYITHAEITGSLKLGGFLLNTVGGLKLKYVGRG